MKVPRDMLLIVVSLASLYVTAYDFVYYIPKFFSTSLLTNITILLLLPAAAMLTAYIGVRHNVNSLRVFTILFILSYFIAFTFIYGSNRDIWWAFTETPLAFVVILWYLVIIKAGGQKNAFNKTKEMLMDILKKMKSEWFH